VLNQRGVGIFSDYLTTETALHELKNSDFLMSRVSVVGRDINYQVESSGANTSTLMNVGNLDTDENVAKTGAKTGAVAGSAVGGIAGLLVGLGVIAIPGIGPIMLAGAAATAIATTISGSAIGAAAGSLAGGLLGLGIPEDRAHVYSDRVAQGDYLVMVEGSNSDIALAASIFSRRGIHEWHVYDFHSDSAHIATPITTHYL
jgi:hypothetical protein